MITNERLALIKERAINSNYRDVFDLLEYIEELKKQIPACLHPTWVYHFDVGFKCERCGAHRDHIRKVKA